jgi:hypothetical protein
MEAMSMPQWEYTVIGLISGMKDAGVSTQKELLDKYGLEGWELVTVSALSTKQGPDLIAYLKREKLQSNDLVAQ